MPGSGAGIRFQVDLQRQQKADNHVVKAGIQGEFDKLFIIEEIAERIKRCV